MDNATCEGAVASTIGDEPGNVDHRVSVEEATRELGLLDRVGAAVVIVPLEVVDGGAFGGVAMRRDFPGSMRPCLRLEPWMQFAGVVQEHENGKAGDGYLGKRMPSRPLHAVTHRRQSRKHLKACRHVGAVMDETMIFPALRFAPRKRDRASHAHS